MKIEIRENEVILRAENEWEKKGLDTLESRSIDRIRFEEPWDNTGGLMFVSKKDPYDNTSKGIPW